MKEDLKELERHIRVLLAEFIQKHEGVEVSGSINPVYISQGVYDRYVGHKIKLSIEVNNND